MTVLPILPITEWWIRIFDFPRLQIFTGLLVAALLWAVLGGWRRARDQIFLIACLAALLWQGVQIFPYTPLARTTVIGTPGCDPTFRLSLLVANVHQENRETGPLLSLIEAQHPDLLLLLETDAWWAGQLQALDEAYPFSVKRPLENTYGLHFFSRLPLVAPQLRFLVEPEIPSVSTRVRLPGGDLIRFFGAHPRPPVPGQEVETRDAELLLIGREVANGTGAAILAGDLNDVAWSQTTRLFLRISGMLDPRMGRGLYPTFPANLPFLAWPLDHMFNDEFFTLVALRRLPDIGSDHYPIAATFCYVPAAAQMQPPPAPQPGDASTAGERIEEGLEAAPEN
jgi:endonuclease/exonuclease/phosphatase (EEP) superfamily protein YafD